MHISQTKMQKTKTNKKFKFAQKNQNFKNKIFKIHTYIQFKAFVLNADRQSTKIK